METNGDSRIASDVLTVRGGRGLQARVFQHARVVLVRQLAHLVGQRNDGSSNPLQGCGCFRIASRRLPHQVDLHADYRKLLCEIVVQFQRDLAALLFAGGHQLRGQGTETLLITKMGSHVPGLREVKWLAAQDAHSDTCIDRDKGPVLAAQAPGCRDRVARDHAAPEFQKLRRRVEGLDIENTHPEQLLADKSKVLACLPVDLQNAALLVVDNQGVRGLPEKRPEALFALFQQFPIPISFPDIPGKHAPSRWSGIGLLRTIGNANDVEIHWDRSEVPMVNDTDRARPLAKVRQGSLDVAGRGCVQAE
jgi:hypothetical protein